MQKERQIGMNEKRPKKKKAMLIVLSSIAAILLCIGTAGYVWYRNSPFPTALKIATAIRDGDMDAVLDCIEPGTAQKIELIRRHPFDGNIWARDGKIAGKPWENQQK